MSAPPSGAEAFRQAVIFYRQGRFEDAAASCRAALASHPRQPAALQMMGVIEMRRQRPVAAVDYFDRLLKIHPNSPDVLSNRGMALHDLGRHKEALASYDAALRLKPDYVEAMTNRANLLSTLGENVEAARAYAQVQRLAPSRPYVLGSVLSSRLMSCDWTGFDALTREIDESIDRGEAAEEPLSFAWHTQSAARQLRCSEIHAAKQFGGMRPQVPRLHPEHPRIRLAYLSADFRDHVVAHTMAGLFERHDRARFELTAISYGPNDGSAMRNRLERAFDHFVDVRSMDDAQVAKLLRQAEIDIAVDLTGYTTHHRMAILAHRPAPIQIHYQGFPATLGATFIDYMIADRIVVPPELESFYREKVIRLPDNFLANDNSQPVPGEPPPRGEFGLPERGFVFCGFNNRYKISPPFFDVWMRLLSAVDGSVLWLRQENNEASTGLRREAERRGISAGRLVFADRIDLADHLARHRLADLFLDTFPYNAHSTAAHALWCGVPILTLCGETLASRVATSLLRAAGLPELSVKSLLEYETLALKLATHPDLLAPLRQKAERARLESPLFDTDRLRRNLESAYLTVYDRARRGEPPASFDVV
jgi:protein O-GlcNAc transferase